MAWELDEGLAVPVLANGDYGIAITDEARKYLQGSHGRVASLQARLYLIVAQGARKQGTQRAKLRAAFQGDGRLVSDQLSEIWQLVK